MLVVLAILGVVIAGCRSSSRRADRRADQTNRTQAQQHARLALDKLRREIRCAGDGHADERLSGVRRHGHARRLLPGNGRRHDRDVVHQGQERDRTACRRRAAVHAVALRRQRRSGTGTLWASNLVDAPSVTAGTIFDASPVPAATLTHADRHASVGHLLVRRHGGCRRTASSRASSPPSPGFECGDAQLAGLPGGDAVQTSSAATATSGLLKNVTAGTTFIYSGPARLTDDPLTLPSATIKVSNTANFNVGPTRSSSPLRRRYLHRQTATSFTGCSGGLVGRTRKTRRSTSASSPAGAQRQARGVARGRRDAGGREQRFS